MEKVLNSICLVLFFSSTGLCQIDSTDPDADMINDILSGNKFRNKKRDRPTSTMDMDDLFASPDSTVYRYPEKCHCTNVYDPVCADDERSYFNTCQMRCVTQSTTLKVIHVGKCLLYDHKIREPIIRKNVNMCNCPDVYSPVCATNNEDYLNACYMICLTKMSRVKIAHHGYCLFND